MIESQRFESVVRAIGERVFVDETPGFDEREAVGVLLNGKLPKKDRLEAGVILLGELAPQLLKDKLADYFSYKDDKLPFPKDFALAGKLDEGGVNLVMLLQNIAHEDKNMVLKIPKYLPKDILDYTKFQKKEYEEVASYFGAVPHLSIPHEYHLIAHSPRANKASPITIQEFIGGDIYDVFTQFDESMLLEKIQSNEGLFKAFSGFVSTIRLHPELIEKEIDMLGKNNLCIVSSGDGDKLVLLDPHYRSVKNHSASRKVEITERLQYIESLVSKAKQEN